MANVLICCYYTSVILGKFEESCCSIPFTYFHLAIIGFVITFVDRRSGIPKVSPQYPNAQAASSHFSAFQYPQDVELGNLPTKLPTGKANQADAEEKWTEIPL